MNKKIEIEIPEGKVAEWKEINSTLQRIGQDMIEMQKVINEQNQKVYEELVDEVDNH